MQKEPHQSGYSSHYEKFPATGEVRCIDDEIPFDIPDTWCWVRLGELISTQTGLAYSKPNLEIKSPKMVRVLRGGNISNGSWQVKANDVMISSEFVKVNLYLQKGYFITPAVTSWENLGKTALVREDYDDIVVGGFVLMMCPFYTDSVIEEYLNDFFQSVLFQQYCRNITNKSGQAFYNLSRSKLLNLLIPIPPKEEQERIITKCNELFPIIEKYGVAQNKLDTLNSEIKSILKKSILQEAIQGRLVEQCETDEPVSKLLERIQEEKRQLVKQGKLKAKDLTNSTIFRGDDNKYYEQVGDKCIDISEEIPFDIPSSWQWVRIKNIFFTTSGGTPLKGHPEYYQNGTIPWVKSGELRNKYLYSAETFITEEALKHSSAKFFPTDTVAVAMYGATIGKTSILKTRLTTNQAICGIFPNGYIVPEFLYYFIQAKTPDYLSMAFGSGQPNISQDKIKRTLMPIPPLAEQKRIVERIDELYSKL